MFSMIATDSSSSVDGTSSTFTVNSDSAGSSSGTGSSSGSCVASASTGGGSRSESQSRSRDASCGSDSDASTYSFYDDGSKAEGDPTVVTDDISTTRASTVNILGDVDVCVTTISSKPPSLPLREELPSLGVECIYNAKGTGMRGVRRAYRDARPPPVPVRKRQRTKRTIRQKAQRLKRRLLRSSSTGSVCTTCTTSGIIPQKVAVSYEAYQQAALRSPGSSVASTSNNVNNVNCDSDNYNLDADNNVNCDNSITATPDNYNLDADFDAINTIVQKENNVRNNLTSADIKQPIMHEGDVGTMDLSYHFHSSESSLLEQDACASTSQPQADGLPPPAALPPTMPLQKLERWVEVLRNSCCLGYLNVGVSHAEALASGSTRTKVGAAGRNNIKSVHQNKFSQDADMKVLRKKVKDRESSGSVVGSGDNVPVTKRVSTDARKRIGDNGSPAVPSNPVEATRYENDLFSLLAQDSILPAELKELLDSKPDLIASVDDDSGQTPIHFLCKRGPSLDPRKLLQNNYEERAVRCATTVNRNGEDNGDDDRKATINARRILNDLLEDVSNLRIMLKLITWADMKACCTMDNASDLPVHILARRFADDWGVMDICDPSDDKSADLTSAIHQVITDCIEVVLRPVAECRELCKINGSCGILPLHIASLFHSSYETLHLLLEQHPEATHVPVSVSEGVNDTESNMLLPFELFELRKFVTSTESSRDIALKSDLLFAFNPNIPPARRDKSRLQRLESIVRCEVEEKTELTMAVASVWMFMVTFTCDDEKDHYAENVRRIIHGLKPVALLRLIAITDRDRHELLDIANEQCAKAINQSLLAAAQDGDCSYNVSYPFLLPDSYSSFSISSSQSFQRTKEADIRGDMGRLCKCIFRMRQNKVPSSFIILPYRLKEENGRCQLASTKDFELAATFAAALVKLTESRAILHTLETKFCLHRVSDNKGVSSLPQKELDDILSDELAFLDMFTSTLGYLYLLDDVTGFPVVSGGSKSASTYPIVISNAYNTIKKLLPLMQMGMLLMRGNIQQLSKVIIGIGNTTVSSQSWLEAAKKVLRLANHHCSDEELLPSLTKCVSVMSTKAKTASLESDNGTEWIMEVSYLKTLLEQFDGHCNFAGLVPSEIHGTTVWSRPENEKYEYVKEDEEKYSNPLFDLRPLPEIYNKQEQSEVSSMSSSVSSENGGLSQISSDLSDDIGKDNAKETSDPLSGKGSGQNKEINNESDILQEIHKNDETGSGSDEIYHNNYESGSDDELTEVSATSASSAGSLTAGNRRQDEPSLSETSTSILSIVDLDADIKEDHDESGFGFSGFCAQECMQRDHDRNTGGKIDDISYEIILTLTSSGEEEFSLDLKILNEEDVVIEAKGLDTDIEVYALAQELIVKEQEVREKEAQINEVQTAITILDNTKGASAHDREVTARELTHILHLYENEFHSVASMGPKHVEGEVRLRAVHFHQQIQVTKGDNSVTYDMNQVQDSLEVHLYDLEHCCLSKDIELEQLRLEFHYKEIEITREKTKSIRKFSEQFNGRSIAKEEYEKEIELLTQPIENDLCTLLL